MKRTPDASSARRYNKGGKHVDAEKQRASVREGYSEIAKGQTCCCGGSPDQVAQAIGYA
jgi:hypothetical protein